MQPPHPPLPLEGLYLHLVRQGFPLSIRDYEAALSALRCGYGLPRREDLQWLCTTLWARTDQEGAALDRLFRQFPTPTREEVRTLAGDRAPPPTRNASKKSATATDRQTHSPQENAPIVEF